ncbi:ImmA/IrrE family metallo-endopeptidase [Paenibacillus crassostreae]|uniref:XRE family transcriptional regulator n=1 Tax=Paenibacillus crassostreae TaxID=1763538 RepID=A0A167E1X7_9BACL|nr:ImmA/IrrE family metallo-endopeptidase [Paenibacillus crassostreae]AOZ93319.1 XRE family transcriptional regulator [Paenibacillus crassostreae]OAB75036.1 XRE family transcriptional regulator [Paenibacillus crassostreae]
MVNHYEYEPNYAVPPGETLLDTLEELGMTQAELAKRMNRPVKTINEIIKGKAEITPATSLELEKSTGVPSALWNNLEKKYRDKLARIKERARLENQVDFLKNIPVKDMIQRGWITECKDSIEQLIEVLKFFRISTTEAWEAIWGNELSGNVAFRKTLSYESDKGAISSWLRRGEIEAEQIICNPFNKTKFKYLLENDLKTLTKEPNPDQFLPELIQQCSDVGVAVVIIRELPGCRVNGATYWTSSNKAIIQLSGRYRSDDRLWFTFFHEAAHIILHGKKETFLECKNDGGLEEKEEEADKFATQLLIPHASYRDFIEKSVHYSHQNVELFATEIGVSPGIVVGRLQHDGIIPFSHLNQLKQRYVWTEE